MFKRKITVKNDDPFWGKNIPLSLLIYSFNKYLLVEHLQCLCEALLRSLGFSNEKREKDLHLQGAYMLAWRERHE